MRGAILADNYLAALAEVLQEEVNARGSTRREGQQSLPLPSLDLPPPLLCAPWLCGIAPQCASTYVPRAPGDTSGLGHLVSTNKLVPQLRTPEPLLSDGEFNAVRRARVDGDSSSLSRSSTNIDINDRNNSSWRHVLFSKTMSAVRRASEQHRGYLDKKYVLQSPPGSTAKVQDSNRLRLTLCLPRGYTTSTDSTQTSSRYHSHRLFDDSPHTSVSMHDRTNGGVAQQFISLCYPWTGQYPPLWLPISPNSVRLWIDGVLVTNRSNIIRFAAADEAAPMSDGPCATIFIEGSHDDDGTSEDDTGSSNRHSRRSRKTQSDISGCVHGGESYSSSNEYIVDIEPAAPDKHVTISHVLWR